MQKTRQQMELRLAEKLGKTIKSPTRSPLDAISDRATVASGIVVRVAADDMGHFTAAVAQQMSVYASSVFLGRNAPRANIAPQARHF